jgi:hypothetical protein
MVDKIWKIVDFEQLREMDMSSQFVAMNARRPGNRIKIFLDYSY